MRNLKNLKHYLILDPEKFLETLNYFEKNGDLNKFFHEVDNFDELSKKKIINLFIRNPRYRCYLEFFRNIKILNPLKDFSNDIDNLMNSLPLINYEITDNFSTLLIIKSLFQRGKIKDVSRIIKELELNSAVLFKLSTLCLERGQETLAEVCIDRIQDWEYLNKNIYITELHEFLKENNLKLIKKIFDKIDWSNAYLFQYVEDSISFNDEIKLFFLTEIERVRKFIKEQLNYNGSIKRYPKFNINNFNKINRKIILEYIKNEGDVNNTILFLNFCTSLKENLPNLDEQLLIPYMKNLKLFSTYYSRLALPSTFLFCNDFSLLREMYSDRRIIKIIFNEKKIDVSLTRDLIESYKELVKRQIPKEEFILKKPKTLTDVHNHLVRFLSKIKQDNFKLNQSEISFLNGMMIGDFLLKLPVDSHELVDIGLNLNICVGNSFYAKKVLNKESNVILLLNPIGSIVVGVLELKNGEILQCKGENNRNIQFRLPKDIKQKLIELS